MRGIYTPVTKIRRQVFEKVAELAFSNDYSKVDDIPYEIIKGEVASYRESVFKERAIVAERIRLACGLSVRQADEHAPLSRDFNKAVACERVYEPPLVEVIPFACNACPETAYEVTNNCRNCLAHPCTSVCPVKAVSIVNGKSFIDKEKCVKCGRCAEACPYNAIVKYDRPCAAACGVDAIESDHLGRAQINHDKCVSCGQCLVHCPFAAISDKSQIFQLILALKSNNNVIAEIAPAFVGQFGPLATPNKVKAALLEIGFKDVYEVALGADAGAIAEAEHFLHAIPNEQPLLATSCCPSWSVMAKTLFPELAECVSGELTPMVATARMVKKDHPDAKVVFIGPCAAKKLEAFRRTVKSDVDFVITFEELMGIFAAKNIDFTQECGETVEDAAATGRGYGVAGGVADAIVSCIKKMDPEREVLVDRAEGLRNCRKMLTLAKAGKRNGYLLEGMACEGGCIGGAGTLQPLVKAAAQVKKFASESPYPNVMDKK
ncbi:4Fe-4S dicluster domain-containing protein [Paludicola sp. MB14-C6]|uniref:4Fe-4S dicluster domain-containing protein n=1 Tax=Paludihabitans sp. MB14-C6 TaxID=3070656 RepID=UPI0027DC7269|nr:4Fe-4S dicluster domain-containing protein [Paludicola sp. MB14-C6]WMJ22188.1 4Fe-4S dicluster domain-containing protein [Paludicola sp. MB14-C6]